MHKEPPLGSSISQNHLANCQAQVATWPSATHSCLCGDVGALVQFSLAHLTSSLVQIDGRSMLLAEGRTRTALLFFSFNMVGLLHPSSLVHCRDCFIMMMI